jgi:hypothetical protein
VTTATLPPRGLQPLATMRIHIAVRLVRRRSFALGGPQRSVPMATPPAFR